MLQKSCDGKIVLDELTESINKRKLNKSHGKDGLTVEFYRAYWKKIKMSHENDELSDSQKVEFKKGNAKYH